MVNELNSWLRSQNLWSKIFIVVKVSLKFTVNFRLNSWIIKLSFLFSIFQIGEIFILITLKRLPLRRYQVIVLAIASYVNFTSNLAFTVLATFFDENAAAHGLTEFKSGLIVAIYALTAALMCPIFGAALEKIGRKFTLVSGLIVASVCAGLFSLLDQES